MAILRIAGPQRQRLDTGPLFGYRMTQPAGSALELETQLLLAENLTLEALRRPKLRLKGARRPLRFQPTACSISLGADQRSPYLELRFTVPRGCYATSLLRELFADPASDHSVPGTSGGT